MSAHIDSASLQVQAGPLQTDLLGGFDLMLELGPSAPEATQVSLGGFSLKNASGVLAASLSLSTDLDFPVEVGVGQSKAVHCTLSNNAVDDTTRGELCSGEIWYSGTVTDTLSDGKPTAAVSSKLAPVCP